MTTFTYELHDSYGASRTIELDLPFDGEWKQGHGVPNGSLATGDCMICLNADYQDRLVSNIFELNVLFETSFDVMMQGGQIVGVDFQFGIESDYNFDNDDQIRNSYIRKLENYTVDSVRFVD